MKKVHLFLLLFCSLWSHSQVPDLYKELYNSYPEYKVDDFETRRFKHVKVKERLKEVAKDSAFTIKQVGKSMNGRELYLLSIGTGKTNVLLWSQMHGDESTATRALFDIFNFFKSEGFEEEKQDLLSNVRLHFLPMLNPDGAENFQRRNSLGVDLNRDALRLQSPESKVLKRIRDSIKPEFGFNLHDQSKYYNVQLTEKPATISFLAPPYNYEKSINEVRANAMKLIVEMNEILQEYIPGQVGKYEDDFEPRAFGDNIQKWGTSTVLIESGGLKNDPEKEQIRRLNYTIILSSLFSISSKAYEENKLGSYDSIPQNDRMLVDLKISGFTYNLKGKKYILDLGINRREIDETGSKSFYYSGEVADRGDLRTSFGYDSLNASGYELVLPKVSPAIYSMNDLKKLDFHTLLKEGYAYLKINDLPAGKKHTAYPVNLVTANHKAPKGITTNFFLSKNGQLEYAVINGFLLNLNEKELKIANALILK